MAPKTFVETMRPMYSISRLMGLAPFHYPPEPNRMCPVSMVTLVVALCVPFFGILCVCQRQVLFIHSTEWNMGILEYANIFHLTASFVLSFFVTVSHFLNRACLGKIIEMNESIDRNLTNINCKMNFICTKVFLGFVFVGIVSIIIFMICTGVLTTLFLGNPSNWLVYVLFCMSNFNIFMMSLQFANGVFGVGMRFVAINLSIEKLGADLLKQQAAKVEDEKLFDANVTTCTEEDYITERQDIEENENKFEIEQTQCINWQFCLKTLSNEYDNNCKVVDSLNHCFSVCIMSSFAVDFSYTLIALFSFYKVSQLFTWSMAVETGLALYSCLFSAINKTVLIHFCNSSKNTAKRACSTCFKFITKLNDERPSQKFRDLANQVKCNEINFTCGMFQFDWPFVMTMICGLASHLVMLIQFDQQSTKKVE